VRPLPLFRAEDVALVGLRSPPFRFLLDRPTADRFELDSAIGTPCLEQASDAGLDDFVIPGRTHDLDFPLEVADPGSGVIAAHCEEAFVVFPRNIVQDDDRIGVGRVVVLT